MGSLHQEDHVGVVGHVLLDEGRVAAAEHLVVLARDLDDLVLGPLHHYVSVPFQWRPHLGFDLRPHDDGVIHVEAELGLERRQETVHEILVGNLVFLVDVRDEVAVHRHYLGQHDVGVLANAETHEAVIDGLLSILGPSEDPAIVPQGQAIGML